MAGDKQAVQIRTRKFIRNNLLARKQFVSFCSGAQMIWRGWA
jgi:hypothetical protein